MRLQTKMNSRFKANGATMQKLKQIIVVMIGIFWWFANCRATKTIVSESDDDFSINKEYIRSKVERSIKHHLSRKDRLELMGQRWDRHHQDSKIYTLSRFPYYSLYFENNDLISLTLSGAWSSDSYASSGHTQDLSKLIFGQGTITTKEIVCGSKLLVEGKIQGISPADIPTGPNDHDPKLHYLYTFADQPFNLRASLDEYSFNINYARHFIKNQLAVGFYVPLKIRAQSLKLTNDLSQVFWNQQLDNEKTIKTLEPKATELLFSQIYGNDIEAFFTDILERKGMSFNKKDTITGFGDVAIYANLDIPSNFCDRFVIGLSVQIPTAQDRDTSKLWYADLGNGGFTELSAFTSLMWLSSKKWFNPFVHAKAAFPLVGHVDRRVPKQDTYDATTNSFNGEKVAQGTLAKGYLLFGETLRFIYDGDEGTSFSEPDTTHRSFSDYAINIAIQPGPSLFLRLGNTFEYVFSHKGFFDVYYNFFAKGKDHLHKQSTDSYYKGGVLLDNTFVISHTIAAAYSYSFDKDIRVGLDGSWVFAGKNTPKTLGVELFFNAEF